MTVYTSVIYKSFADALDITVKGKHPLGRLFAPTWEMVLAFKNGKMSEAEYEKAYLELMRKSYKENKAEWMKLFERESVTLMCYCKAGAFCHRRLLAQIFIKMGAKDGGER